MKVNRLGFQNYRNLKSSEIYPDEGVNVIYGDNAQGKTNLLEAVWMFTGGRSFRGAKDSELIDYKNSEKGAVLTLDFQGEQRDQTAKITIDGISKKRSAQLNGVNQPAPSSLIGKFCAVVFSPDHLSLIKEGPSFRRKFIDGALCQKKPAYARLLSQYSRVLSQRNILLKDILSHGELLDTLEIWDEKLARLGASMMMERSRYIKNLSLWAEKTYVGISKGKESFSAEYESTVWKDGMTEEDVFQAFFSLLKQGRKEDLSSGFTIKGPHRDDLFIQIQDKPAREYGSQGQQRSCVLALKLAEAACLSDSLEEKPVILLDDVMSELDSSRQDYLLNQIQGWQVFITCCDPNTVMGLSQGKTFFVENGTIQ